MDDDFAARQLAAQRQKFQSYSAMMKEAASSSEDEDDAPIRRRGCWRRPAWQLCLNEICVVLFSCLQLQEEEAEVEVLFLLR